MLSSPPASLTLVHRYAPRLGMHAVRGAGCLQHCLQSPLSCSNSTILLHTPNTLQSPFAACSLQIRASPSVLCSAGCCCVIPPGCCESSLAPVLSKHELSQNLIAVIDDSNKATLSLATTQLLITICLQIQPDP